MKDRICLLAPGTVRPVHQEPVKSIFRFFHLRFKPNKIHLD